MEQDRAKVFGEADEIDLGEGVLSALEQGVIVNLRFDIRAFSLRILAKVIIDLGPAGGRGKPMDLDIILLGHNLRRMEYFAERFAAGQGMIHME